MVYKGTYDFSASYAKNSVVRVTGSIIKYYYGSPEVKAWSYPGTYICVSRSLAAHKATASFFMPIYPEPAVPLWQLLSFGPTEIVSCNAVGQNITLYYDAQEKEPANGVSQSIHWEP